MATKPTQLEQTKGPTMRILKEKKINFRPGFETQTLWCNGDHATSNMQVVKVQQCSTQEEFLRGKKSSSDYKTFALASVFK